MAKRPSPQPVVAPWRLQLVVLALAALCALLFWRILSLQVLDNGRGYQFLQHQGNVRTIRTEVIPAHRGMISDRNGQPLAVSTPVASIWGNPRELVQAREHWPQLARALGIDSARLAQRLEASANQQFIYLRRHLSPADAESVMSMAIPGVYLQREYRRFYPAGEVAAHLVGFTNIDDQGQEGIELAYDHWLRGVPGSKKVLKDLYGNIIRDLDDGRPVSPGGDLMLSIDLRLQHLAYRELKAALQRHGAKAGTIVMLDSKTGEVLAMVNQPSYNPNSRGTIEVGALRNRALTDVFEPGSTVKAFTLAAALSSGKFRADTVIDTHPGHIRVDGKTLVDPVNYGQLDLGGILLKSSQVGTSKLALELDPQDMWRVFQDFGLGQSTGTGFPGESNGVLPNRIRWRPIERVNFAFGYGLSVTALQLAQAYAVFANDGYLTSATLLKRSEPASTVQVLDEDISRQLLQMLAKVTLAGGTGTRAQVESYSTAGKTGTTHMIGDGGYAYDRYRALFVGLAPATNPRVVTVVTIDEPSRGMYYGGEVAAPIFSRVTADAMRLLNIAPDQVRPEAIAESKDKRKSPSA